MSPKFTLSKLTILIVDDDRDNSHILRQLFAHAGWKAVVESDSTAALETVRRVRPDVVLLDMMMPVMDGLDVLAAMRNDADAAVAATRVVMYSAICDPATRESALTCGADDYVVKTTPFGQVHERVSRCAVRQAA